MEEVKPNILLYYFKKLDKKYSRFIASLDQQILRNLRRAEIETRAVQSNGLWCCLLIPTILFLYSCLYDLPRVYIQTSCLSAGLLSYSFLFIIFITVSSAVLTERTYGGLTASCFISTILLYTWMDRGLLFSLGVSAVSVYMYNILLRACIVAFPKTFTLGELMVVLQGSILFYIGALFKLFTKTGDETDDEILVNTVIVTVLSTVGLIVTALYNLRDDHRTLVALSYIVIGAAAFVLLVLHLLLGASCLFRILRYILFDQRRAQLFSFWLFLLLLSVVVLVLRTRVNVKASTVTRKSFHVLAALVFMSGILSDLLFMRFAAGLALGVLILVEALRKSDIEPISSALQTAFNVYKDEKDSGNFALTPIYLYVGLACPLVLVPPHAGAPLELLSGVLATGVGDTAACWFGERYGVTRWPDGNRTYEGTAFNILSQILTVYTLQIFELLDVKHALLRTTVAAIFSGYVEARTEQVDNLVLPLTTLIAFQATWFLA